MTVNDNCTITYDGVTSKVEVEKSNIKTTDRPYWECSDGSTITPGSVVVAENPGGIDHAWIYIGEFDSRNDVVSYLKSIGVRKVLSIPKQSGTAQAQEVLIGGSSPTDLRVLSLTTIPTVKLRLR